MPVMGKVVRIKFLEKTLNVLHRIRFIRYDFRSFILGQVSTSNSF